MWCSFLIQTPFKQSHETSYGWKPYSCDVCQKTFRHLNTLKDHKTWHTGIKKYKCTEQNCSQKFSTNQALTSHVNTNHKDIRLFQCTVCQKAFHTKGNLRNHGVVHTGEKLFKCPNCQKLYAWQSSLDYHMKTQHSETQETFACDICDRVCLTKGNLQVHLKTHLLERKVYKCRTCEKSFLHKISLLHHEKIAQGRPAI